MTKRRATSRFGPDADWIDAERVVANVLTWYREFGADKVADFIELPEAMARLYFEPHPKLRVHPEHAK